MSKSVFQCQGQSSLTWLVNLWKHARRAWIQKEYKAGGEEDKNSKNERDFHNRGWPKKIPRPNHALICYLTRRNNPLCHFPTKGVGHYANYTKDGKPSAHTGCTIDIRYHNCVRGNKQAQVRFIYVMKCHSSRRDTFVIQSLSYYVKQ